MRNYDKVSGKFTGKTLEEETGTEAEADSMPYPDSIPPALRETECTKVEAANLPEPPLPACMENDAVTVTPTELDV